MRGSADLESAVGMLAQAQGQCSGAGPTVNTLTLTDSATVLSVDVQSLFV